MFKNKKYVFDGGMGQLLIDRGMVTNGTLWSATALIDEGLNNLVLDSHIEFIEAGAEIIVTNNFKVRKNTFAENNVIEKFDLANQRAGQIAFEAKKKSNKEILVAGSISTRGITYQPHLNYNENNVYEEFQQTASALDPYVDFFYLDVFCSIKEIKTVFSAIKKFNKPAILGLHFKKDFLLPSDENINQVSLEIKQFNCAGVVTSCVSPEIYEGVLPFLKKQNYSYGFAINAFIDIPENIELNEKFSLQPNDFLGLRVDLTPEKFSDFGIKSLKEGAKFLKGCCNIMPAHIKSLCLALNNIDN